jgi:hypothetical protein
VSNAAVCAEGCAAHEDGARTDLSIDALCYLRCMSWISRRTISTTPLGVLFVVVVSIAAVAFAGCIRSRRATYGTVPTVDARQVERLRRVGERDMRCPRGSLVMIPMTQNAVELRGCERIREYSLVCRRGRRCNWQPMTPAALLATRDLACPLEAMSVAAPSASTRDLVGCGRMGRYAIACLDDAVCRWNLLAPVGPDVAAVPPASYGATYGPAPAPPSAPSQGPVTGPVPPPPGSGASEVPPPPGASLTVSGQVTVSEVPPPPPGSSRPR